MSMKKKKRKSLIQVKLFYSISKTHYYISVEQTANNDDDNIMIDHNK